MPARSRRVEQVAEAITRDAAALGQDLRPGDAAVWLPSWEQMARAHRASKSTVRAALVLLVERGVVELVPRQGARVLPPQRIRRTTTDQSRVRGRWRGFGAAAADAGGEARSETVSVADMPCPTTPAEFLGVAGGVAVVERARVHWIEARDGTRTPVYLSWTWVHPDVSAALPVVRAADTGPGGLTSRFAEHGWTPTWPEYDQRARNASPAEAEALRVPVGQALAEVWRPCVDEVSGRVLEVTVMAANPAVHSFIYP